jgi:hypothetical protein
MQPLGGHLDQRGGVAAPARDRGIPIDPLVGALLVELVHEAGERGHEGVEGKQGIVLIGPPPALDACPVEVPGQPGEVKLLD